VRGKNREKEGEGKRGREKEGRTNWGRKGRGRKTSPPIEISGFQSVKLYQRCQTCFLVFVRWQF